MRERWPELADAASRLDDAAFEQLVTFARFLASRERTDSQVRADAAVTVPAPPEGETVVAAVRRLRSAYSMIDPRLLLGDVGEIMTRHAVEALGTKDAIVELEEVFLRQYQRRVQNNAKPPEPTSD